MTIKELKERLLKLQDDTEKDFKALCNDAINCMFNCSESLGEEAQPIIQDLLHSLYLNNNSLFKEILELIDKLK